MQFTTRPEITGTFGVVTLTHWNAAAMRLMPLSPPDWCFAW